jgi:hypothetical protein
MFEVKMMGSPALNLILLEDMDTDTLYLSADQKCVVMQDRENLNYVVFDLVSPSIRVYEQFDTAELGEVHKGAALLLPKENASVVMKFEIGEGIK